MCNSISSNIVYYIEQVAGAIPVLPTPPSGDTPFALAPDSAEKDRGRGFCAVGMAVDKDADANEITVEMDDFNVVRNREPVPTAIGANPTSSDPAPNYSATTIPTLY